MKKLLLTILLLFSPLTAGIKDLTDISTVNKNIKLDLRYATKNNFTKNVLYSAAKCYVLKIVAQKLDAIAQELAPLGIGIKIYDGFRPFDAQCKMWELVPDERYVSPPSNGGRHTRGTTVDLTLIRLSDGSELEMPTGFDDFTKNASSNYVGEGVSLDAVKNRLLLKLLMEKHGFVQLRTEWWHFDLVEWKSYEPIKATLEEIEVALSYLHNTTKNNFTKNGLNT